MQIQKRLIPCALVAPAYVPESCIITYGVTGTWYSQSRYVYLLPGVWKMNHGTDPKKMKYREEKLEKINEDRRRVREFCTEKVKGEMPRKWEFRVIEMKMKFL